MTRRSNPSASPKSMSPPALIRSRSRTADDLLLAIQRLQKRGLRISIASVAKEAGFSAPLLHNTYPDIAERIRQLGGKGVREQRDKTRDALAQERTRTKLLRDEVRTLKDDLGKLASVNQALLFELSIEKKIAAGLVVPLLRPKG